MASASVRPLRIVITGARGLGRGLARCLLQRGHRIHLLDVNEAELHHTLTVHLPKHASSYPKQTIGTLFAGSQCDVSKPEEVVRAVQEAASNLGGGFDVLVNMAANTQGFQFQPPSPGQPGLLAENAFMEWQKSMNVNLTGAFLCAQQSVKYLSSPSKDDRTKEKDASEWGNIINISSSRALQSEPNSEGYAATKAGLLGLTHALASSLSPSLIRVNAILPGWIPAGRESIEGDEKGLTWESDLTKEDHVQHWSRRVGKVEDLASTVEWMATCGFLNAQCIALDGGMTKKMIYAE